MCLVPIHKPFYGPLFDRLSFIEHSTPIQKLSNGLWSLDREVVDHWDALERNLRAILFAMLHCSMTPRPKLFQFWGFPRQYGYIQCYHRRQIAESVASRSRDAFAPLLAAILFLFLCLENEARHSSTNWRESVLTRTGIHHMWLAELELSIACDFSIPRVGGIIDMATCEFQSILPLLSKVNMSMYLHWGHISTLPVNNAPTSFQSAGLVPTGTNIAGLHSSWSLGHKAIAIPDGIACPDHRGPFQLDRSYPIWSQPRVPVHSDIFAATGTTVWFDRPSGFGGNHTFIAAPSPINHNEELEQPVPLSPNGPPPTANSSAPNSAPHPILPPVHPQSGQRQGEDMATFFARRAKRNEERAERETEAKRMSRLQREKNSRSHRPPGRKGARVYVWDDVGGFFVRRPAGRAYYADQWELFKTHQRRYDSFYDEWDLCEAFTDPGNSSDQPEMGSGDSDDDGDDHADGYYYNITQAVSGSAVLPEGNAPSSSLDDLSPPLLPEDRNPPDHNEGTFASTSDLGRIHPRDPLDEVTQLEFNECPQDAVYYRFGFVYPITPVEDPRKKPVWPTIRKYLGNGWQASWAEPPKSIQESLSVFFGYLSAAQTLRDIPRSIYDILDNNAGLFGQLQKVRVRSEILSQTLHYIISLQKEEQGAGFFDCIVLTSAAAVVEILRQGWADLSTISHGLFEKGIAFHTCVRAPGKLLKKKPTPRYGGLGYHPMKTDLGLIDFVAYESRRNQFLCSPRGRAALLAGGIVARIAREALSVEDVDRGPSDSVFEDGLCLESSPLSLAYWDDCLTGDEVDLICGVYRVDTGKQLETWIW
jgi:hypothetical protein